MKFLYTLILVSLTFCASAQYSNYYNVNKNIGVSGNLNINTIDYGQLALANAQREKNNLENQRYVDQREREIYLAIAENPLLAYDYGIIINEPKVRNVPGFSKLSLYMVLPNKSLFVRAGEDIMQNVSTDGITTEIDMPWFSYKGGRTIEDIEKESKMADVNIGTINKIKWNDKKIFVHKKDISRATVWSNKGFVSTLIWEDDYQFAITDSYESISTDGVNFNVKVSYYGNNKQVTFEQIEGRRYYLKGLIEKVIATARIYDYHFK